MASDLVSKIPSEIPDMSMGPFPSTTFAIEARLVSSTASKFKLSRVPPHVHADRPLELELDAFGLGAGAGMELSITSWISAHALLQIAVNIPGHPLTEVPCSLPVKALPSGGGCIIRALARPSVWADAASVTVLSLSLAGRPLPCDFLPATLRVGYNHDPAHAGAVLEAAIAGDAAALMAAIEAGGSTEEADTVWGGERGEPWGSNGGRSPHDNLNPPFLPSAAGVRWYRRLLGRLQRPPRGPPYTPGGRRRPGLS